MKKQSKQLIAVSVILVGAILFSNVQNVSNMFIRPQLLDVVDGLEGDHNIGDTIQQLTWNYVIAGKELSIKIYYPDSTTHTWFSKKVTPTVSGTYVMSVNKRFDQTGMYHFDANNAGGPYGKGYGSSGGLYVRKIEPKLDCSFTIYPTDKITPDSQVTFSYEIQNTGTYNTVVKVRGRGNGITNFYEKSGITLEPEQSTADTISFPYSEDLFGAEDFLGPPVADFWIDAYASIVSSDVPSDWVTNNVNFDKHISVPFETPKYALTVSTNPGGCDVKVNDVTKNSGAQGYVAFELQKGTYTITVSKDKYASVIQTVDMQAAKTVSIALTKNSFALTVSTSVADCLVKLTGPQALQKNATSGLATFDSLPKGTYTVTAEKTGYNAEKKSVTLFDKDATTSLVLTKTTTPTPPSPTPPQPEPPKTNETTPTSKKTPGFEIPLTFLSIILIFYIFRKRRII